MHLPRKIVIPHADPCMLCLCLKWPLCTIPWSLISVVQTVSHSKLWPTAMCGSSHNPPQKTLQSLLFHWGLAKVLHAYCFFTPSSSKKGLMSSPLWIMRMNNKQPSVYPHTSIKERVSLCFFIELSSGCLWRWDTSSRMGGNQCVKLTSYALSLAGTEFISSLMSKSRISVCFCMQRRLKWILLVTHS